MSNEFFCYKNEIPKMKLKRLGCILNKMNSLIFIINFIRIIVFVSAVINPDPSGYLAFCPCMGRFGNQADHYLGAIAFAQKLNRTLILPPWVEYHPGVLKSQQVPFKNYFKIEPLAEYSKVITMEDFMENFAEAVWPKEKRIAFCYMARHNSKGCNPKDGNPFGPFWDTFNVDFIGSELYEPLNYDIHHQDMGRKWSEKYTPERWPVLAFTGAPASFPVQKENKILQKYIQWSDEIILKAEKELSKLPRGPVIGIHLRNGVDWVRACEHVTQSPLLFSAPQCLGYRGENGQATKDLCLPSKEIIIKQLKRVIKSISAKSIFVASDSNHMIQYLSDNLKKMEVSVHKMEESELHVELAILGKTNHFIGNCISSFSAFVKRERDVKGFPSSFWAFPLQKPKKYHTEL